MRIEASKKGSMGNTSLTVSVLTYNRKHFLRQALEAIQEQTYKHFVVKILDNASTDGTEQVVKKFLSDERFRYIRHDENIGASRNYNYALLNCDTDLLLITHDDDRMKPEMLEREVGVLLTCPDVNLVSCENDHIDSEGRVLVDGLYNRNYNLGRQFFQNRYEFILGYLKGVNQISCPTAMLRMSAVRSAGLKFREDVGQPVDTIFWMDLNCIPGRFAFIGESLYEYRLHGGQDSSRNVLKTHVSLRSPVWDILKREGLASHLEEWRTWIDNLILGALRIHVLSNFGYDKELLRSLERMALARGGINFRLKCAFFLAIRFPKTIIFKRYVRRVLSKIKQMLLRSLRPNGGS